MPDPSVPERRVAFGASGHRGPAFNKAFNEGHILAISQAICLYCEQNKIDGPLFLGADTVSSCFVHVRKPNAVIFRFALDIAQTPAGQVVYIENMPMFVEFAEGLGIRSILHRDYNCQQREIGFVRIGK